MTVNLSITCDLTGLDMSLANHVNWVDSMVYNLGDPGIEVQASMTQTPSCGYNEQYTVTLTNADTSQVYD